MFSETGDVRKLRDDRRVDMRRLREALKDNPHAAEILRVLEADEKKSE
jgi:hypothetical protein